MFLSRDAAALGSIYDVIDGVGSSAGAYWRALAANVSTAVHAHMWDEARGAYSDVVVAPVGNKTEWTFSPVDAVSNFYPLWLPDLPSGRADVLAARLTDPASWGLAVPLPSVSFADPAFSTDMWRGPAWVNTNYMVALALLASADATDASNLPGSGGGGSGNGDGGGSAAPPAPSAALPSPSSPTSGAAGRRGLALDLVAAALDSMADNYSRFGVIFEFADAEGVHDPRFLLRKGSHTGGVRDYHWSAALAFRMIADFGPELAARSRGRLLGSNSASEMPALLPVI